MLDTPQVKQYLPVQTAHRWVKYGVPCGSAPRSRRFRPTARTGRIPLSMQPIPKISVAVCTHNRAHYLVKALDSLCRQSLPLNEFEVLVIDNASHDSTLSIVADIKQKLSNLRYVFEPEVGLSKARNTALAQIRAEYIAYLDDDAIASPQWLERILNAFESIKPTPGVVGGRVEPIWEDVRPKWLPDELMGYLTIVDWSAEPKTLDPSQQYVAGANMAFVTSVLRDIDGFNLRLGRVGNSLLSCEELLLQRRLSMLDHAIYYDPLVAVSHHVPVSRLTQQWFFDRVFSQGVSEAVMRANMENLSRIKRVTLALRSLAGFISRPKLWSSWLLSSDDPVHFLWRCHGLKRLGTSWGLISYSSLTG